MTNSERQPRIIELVSRNKSVTITELVDIFGVSVITIRRDLSELAEKKYIKKVYGGAVLNEEELNKPYFPRAEINSLTKDRIAEKAASLIGDGDTIIMDLGTTVLALSKFLGEKKNLSVVTCSLPIIYGLEAYPDIAVYALGGEFKRENHALLGSHTEEEMGRYCADIAFIGVAGISDKYGLTNFYHQTASLCQKIIKQAKKVVVLADSSKFDKAKPAVIGKIDLVDVIITDTDIPEYYHKLLTDMGIEVILVEKAIN